MKPFVKWAGGKEKELSIIKANMPTDIHNYIEPFLGGGAVFLGVEDIPITGKHMVNDYSQELINLYQLIANKNQNFINAINTTETNMQALKNIAANHYNEILNFYIQYKTEFNETQLRDSITNFFYNHNREFNGLHNQLRNQDIDNFDDTLKLFIIRKIKRIAFLESNDPIFNIDQLKEMIETSFLSAYYTHIRHLYNNVDSPDYRNLIPKEVEAAYFYFIREFCYCSMFRYNSSGKFNVPYGGNAYNKKSLMTKLDYIQSEGLVDYLKNSTIKNMDFEKFLSGIKIHANDFIFVDPPYDTDFNEYAQNSFSKNDQTRLADCLSKIQCRIMIVIKETEFISNLYRSRNFNIDSFDKKYNVNFRNRNERKVKHLIIKNY